MSELRLFTPEEVVTVRYECPLRNCGWVYDDAKPKSLSTAQMLSADTVHDIDRVQPTETAARAIDHHLVDHERIEFVREIRILQLELARTTSLISAPKQDDAEK